LGTALVAAHDIILFLFRDADAIVEKNYPFIEKCLLKILLNEKKGYLHRPIST